ncbi:uncharacterized protein G2W53_017220 [Senna tora]|uniref:Uncharacterized protein n=1 Tax=Senna tora TaxID=362788 RepID=A0A834WNR7_9FABA|nr:uncharacterized protein G2W53_017220 [Senna tora]
MVLLSRLCNICFCLSGPKEVEMNVTEPAKKAALQQIVKLDKALKLAEVWVSNMSKVEDDEPTEADKEGRPSRLGLGAKVSRQSKVGPSNDPIERKLYAKLDAKKRKAAQIAEESRSAKDSIEDEDIADEDSRTSAFVKKAALPFSLSVKGNKKRK